MDSTRRLRATAVLGVVVGMFAIVLDRPLALLGMVLLGAWIVSRQYLFYRAITDLSDGLTVTQSPARDRLHTDDSVPVTLAASLETPTRLTALVQGGLPLAAVPTESLELAIESGAESASTTVDARWPVAGRHAFDPVTISVSDGLFEETITVDQAPTVTVEPRGPRALHVGEGGTRLSGAYGEHDAGQLGSGIEPAGLRKYVPGDTADRIDWNATARLGEPYVLEFESETDRRTIIAVDHRKALARGPENERKLDYLREVALAIVDSAERVGDPLGVVTVGDDGLTNRVTPSTEAGGYVAVRRTVLDLEPTSDVGRVTDRSGADQPTTVGRPRRLSKSLADVRRSVAALEGDRDAFARTLRPFYADRQTYLDRIDADPLYAAVRQTVARETGETFTVLCTDDSTPAELRETVKLAGRGGNTVLALLAPTVLYELDTMADAERAYERYVEFEELRRDLARQDGVTALEVGPGDRLSTVLAAGRERAARRRAGGRSA